MLIGANYPKIELDVFGLTILEPMAIVTNFIMAGCSWWIFNQLRKNQTPSLFEYRWNLFFLFYGIAGFTSAFSHGLFLYWGWPSKIPAWGFGVIAVFIVEQAMITQFQPSAKKQFLIGFSLVKALAVLALAFSLLNFLPVAINSIVGLIFFLAIPSAYYQKHKNVGFAWFWKGIVFLLPSAIFFLGKINPHLWLNKDDISHLLMAGSLFFFYKGVVAVRENQ